MTFDQYQELARRTANQELDWMEAKLHALHGIASEVGEIHSIYQKAYQGHAIDVGAVAEEVGDLLWFVAELCDVLDVSMSAVARNNIEKLKKRYPEGFSEERSVHRTI